MKTLSVFLNTAGGLALFLYGLRILSGALKQAIGDQMRTLLERLTGRAYRGVIVGAVTSGILQSSSMTMVLLIGLINAGVLRLSQGVGVMLGAEIGTTLTAQIIAFKVGHYYLAIIAIGFLLAEIFRGRRLGSLGQVILGFGILFLGMGLVSSGLEGLADSSAIMELLNSCGENVLLGIVVGASITAIIQSSSAMTAMVIGMGNAGIITLPAAIGMILGANIGTTITALIASIGLSIASKRLAVAQLFVNVAGVAVFAPFAQPYANMIALTATQLTRQIANAHTFFNVVVTLALIPCVGLLVTVARRLVPGREEREEVLAKFLGDEFLRTPSIAVRQVRQELLRMADKTKEMIELCRRGGAERNRDDLREVLGIERSVDKLKRTIDEFIGRIDVDSISPKNGRQLHICHHVTGDIERVGDQAVNISERTEILLKNDYTFSEQAQRELSEMFRKVVQLYELAVRAFEEEDEETARQALELEEQVDDLEAKYKQNHISRLEKGVCNPNAGILFVEILHNLERIGDHAVNIAGDVLLVQRPT